MDGVPAEHYGEPMLAVAAACEGPPDLGERALLPHRGLARPLADLSGRMPCAQVQRSLDEGNVAWARRLDKAPEPRTVGSCLDFPGLLEEGERQLRASFGPHYERLVDVKTEWDPDNVFRISHTLPPRRLGKAAWEETLAPRRAGAAASARAGDARPSPT
jgi:hypothetical protein